MTRITLTVLACMAISACQTTSMPGSSDITTSNPNANSAQNGGIKSWALHKVDFEYAAKAAVDEFLLSPWYDRNNGKRWIVMMGETINDTTFRIDTASMTARMKQHMVKSGTFVFTAAIGNESTDLVKDYRNLRRSKIFDGAKQSSRKAIIPDLAMLGEIRQQTVINSGGTKQQLEYEFDFRVVDLVSGLELYHALIPIEKLGSNQNFAW